MAYVGVTDPNTQLLLNIIYAIGGWIPAIIGARLHDVVGRRKMLMGVTIGMAVCLSIAAGTAAGFVETGSKSASVASITFIYIFGSVFALAFTSMQPIYPGEVLSNDMRAKGMGVFQLTSGCAGFVNTFAAPVALRNVSIHRYIRRVDAALTFWCRLGTGSTSSSCFGTCSNSCSYTSSTSKRKAGRLRSSMSSSRRPIRGKLVLRRSSQWMLRIFSKGSENRCFELLREMREEGMMYVNMLYW